MDQHPYLAKWLAGERAGAEALLGLVFLVGIALISYVLISRRRPTLAPAARLIAFNGFYLLCILYMLVFHA